MSSPFTLKAASTSSTSPFPHPVSPSSAHFLRVPTPAQPTMSTHPSDIYARPQPPADVQSVDFNWGDDAASTIRPDDSVSQMERRFTGQRKLMGPRPMEGVPAVPSVPEEYAEELAVHHDYVPPELLEDDRSTVIASGGGGSQQGVRAVNPSTSVGPLARARGEGAAGSTTVPYSSPRHDYANDEELDDEHLAGSPLVGGPAAPVPYSSVHSSSNAPQSQRRPQGYAAVGEDGDDYDDGGVYAAYSRSRDADLESKAGLGGHGDRDGSGATGTTLVGGAMGYFKGLSGRHEKAESSFYAPHELAFTPPDGSSSYPPSRNGLQKLPSLDVAGPYVGGITGQGGDGSQIKPKPLLQRWFWDTTPDERRVWEHRNGIGMQRWPYASWLLAVVMTAVRPKSSPFPLLETDYLPSPRSSSTSSSA